MLKAKYLTMYYSETTQQIVEDVVEGVNDGTYKNIEDAINDVLDNDLIYYEDQWDIMKDFQLPSEANFMKALEELIDFIHTAIIEE